MCVCVCCYTQLSICVCLIADFRLFLFFFLWYLLFGLFGFFFGCSLSLQHSIQQYHLIQPSNHRHHQVKKKNLRMCNDDNDNNLDKNGHDQYIYCINFVWTRVIFPFFSKFDMDKMWMETEKKILFYFFAFHRILPYDTNEWMKCFLFEGDGQFFFGHVMRRRKNFFFGIKNKTKSNCSRCLIWIWKSLLNCNFFFKFFFQRKKTGKFIRKPI